MAATVLGYRPPMFADAATGNMCVTPSRRTLHVELLRLCARIGYSPPAA